MDNSRSSNLSSHRSLKDPRVKKPQKIDKSLISAFDSVSEKSVTSLDLSKESSDYSPVSAISCASSQASVSTLHSALAASSAKCNLSEFIQTSHQRISSLDEDSLKKILQNARSHLTNVPYAEHRYKSLLAAINKVVAEESHTFPMEQKWLLNWLSVKGCIACIVILMCGFVLELRSFASSFHSSYLGLPPT